MFTVANLDDQKKIASHCEGQVSQVTALKNFRNRRGQNRKFRKVVVSEQM